LGAWVSNTKFNCILDKCKGFGLADNLQVLIQEFRTNPFLVIFVPLLLLLGITIIRITDEPLFLDFSGDLEKWNQQCIQREQNASLMWIQASSNVRIYEKQHKACKCACLLLGTWLRSSGICLWTSSHLPSSCLWTYTRKKRHSITTSPVITWRMIKASPFIPSFGMLLLSALPAEAPNISQWNAYKESRERERWHSSITTYYSKKNQEVGRYLHS